MINSHLWTENNIQELINSLTSLNTGEIYEYQVEGGHLGLIIDFDEVAFFNLLDRENEKEDFVWIKEKFITFMEAFKKFFIKNKPK